MSDWFCKCCQDHYKRKDATFLASGSMDEVCYQTSGMCTRCYKEANDGNEFENITKEYNDRTSSPSE